MKWEYLGKQEMKTMPGTFGFRGATHFELWRSKVPGGWFVSISNPMVGNNATLTFYPDPEHRWTGKEDEESEADVLLRPSGLIPPPPPGLPPAPEKIEP